MPDRVLISVAKFLTGRCCFSEVLKTPQSTAPRNSHFSKGWSMTCEAAVKPNKAMPSSLMLLMVPAVSVSSHPSGKLSMALLKMAAGPWLSTATDADSRRFSRIKNCAPPSCLKTMADKVRVLWFEASLAPHISIRPVDRAVRSRDSTSPRLLGSKHSRKSRPTKRLLASLNSVCTPILASRMRLDLRSTISTASGDDSNNTR